jgi:inner membrane protein
LPTILSHPAVPLALGVGLGSGLVSRRLLVAGIVASIVPDVDVYLPLDHRGPTHSLVFALAVGALAAAFARALQAPALRAFVFVAFAAASHGLLDAFTTGGGAIEFFWPFSDEGYFMPWQVIEVSNIGIVSFFSKRAIYVLASELTWIWPIAVLVTLALFLARRSD